MNALQKRARSSLIWLPLILFIYLIGFGVNVRIVLYVVSFLGLVVIIGVTPILCQKYLPELFHKLRKIYEERVEGGLFLEKIELDERDRAIKDRANLAGCIAAYSWFFGVCLVASSWDSISGLRMVMIWAAGMYTHIFTRSLALMILYGREGKDGEK